MSGKSQHLIKVIIVLIRDPDKLLNSLSLRYIQHISVIRSLDLMKAFLIPLKVPEDHLHFLVSVLFKITLVSLTLGFFNN